MENFAALKKEELGLYEIKSPVFQPKKQDSSPKTGSAVITCAGDMLVEEKLYKTHKIGSKFDFHDIFHFVKPYFLRSDLSIANLETVICESAPYTGEQYKIDGKYHCNAPIEFLNAVKDSGINFLMMSNNHNLDCGVNGIIETIHNVDQFGFMHTGLFTPEDTERYKIVDVNGIKLALLSYSTWFNRNETKLTDLGRSTFINEYSKEKVLNDVSSAKEKGAEFVLIYIHWGVDAEYKSKPSDSMRKMAKEIADCGADYIVGSHTHSVQPYEEITAFNGKKVPCIFSMGNFATSELSRISRQSLMVQIELEKYEGIVQVKSQRFIPCYIPDEFYNLSYPILPKEVGESKNLDLKMYYENIIKVLDTEEYITHKIKITRERICSILGLPKPEYDEEYTSVRFARDSKKGCVAIISGITSDPDYVTPPQRCIELAKDAIEKGAKLLIVKTEIEGYPCLVVDNVFDAFCRIMKNLRSFYSPKTIGITGSVGKTITTEMVNNVLKSKYNTLGNTGNANSVQYGGYEIQRLSPKHEVYIQEIMEAPPAGTASTISKMVQPDAAIVTVVGSSHMEVFGSKERILESCLGIQDGMPKNGLLILNGDDPYQKNAVCEKNAWYYGIDDETADYRAVNIKTNDTNTEFDIIHGGDTTHIVLYCFGRHNVLDALSAFAAGKWAGMTNEEISAALSKYRTSGIRQNLVRYGGYRIFLDCYNAAVESMKTALEQFGEIPVTAGGKHIAVLADIKEGGEMTVDYHKQVGTIAAASCADIVICFGDDSRYIAEEAQKSKKTYYTDSRNELIKIIKENVTTDDVILFKGSRSMRLEQIVDNIWGTWFSELDAYYFPSKQKNDDDLSYKVYDDHVSVINKISTKSDIVIPNCIENLPVRSISSSAFNRSRYIKHIKFSENLVNIGFCAFYKSNLEGEIVIPSSVRIIYNSAFSSTKLQKVIINDGCTHIGMYAFSSCTELKSIRIPETVRQIENDAFMNCKQLTIYGEAGSYAEAYAVKNKIKFIIENPDEKTLSVLDSKKKCFFEPRLTKKSICSVLGLPLPESDEEYTGLRFAADADEGSAALISEIITSQITYDTPFERCVQLADAAMEKGAKILVSTAQIRDYPCLITPMPIIETFIRIVSEWRLQFDPKTISITGSIGKTSTTEMVYAVISSKYNTHRNTGHANDVRYSGAVIQRLKREHEFYVQETVEGPPFGAAASVAKMVRPQAAIVTLVGTSHMEEFGSQERILESCLGVQEGMPEDGLLILNGDDTFQQKAVTARKTVYYAIENENANYRAINIKNNETGMTFDVLHDGEATPIRLYCFGKHNVLNALAAFAAGKWAGMTNEEIASGIAKYRTSGIRQNLVRFGGQRLFLDCYNAAVESIRSLLNRLAEIPVRDGGKRIAVLADILECGDKAEEYHRLAGKAAAVSAADIVICYGKDAKFIAEEAGKTKRTFYTDSAEELIKLIRENITIKDVVSFKGSHRMALEHIVDRIWGTWFHEEFERYDFLTHNTKDENFSYCVYTDHAAVTKGISTAENVVIPDNVDEKPVTSISPSAFSGSRTVKSVNFPKTLVNIRYCAFYNSCLSGEVILPPSVRIIHDSAFSTCKNLKIVVVNNGCTHLGYRAFGNCTELESIVLPETVRQIGSEAFINCKKLTILGKEGSYAEEYAKNNGIPFSKII